MSRRLERFAPTLRLLNRYSDADKRRWLKSNLHKDLVLCLCECAKNLLKGKVPLTASQRKSLGRRKRALRTLVKRNVSVKQKKKIIQKGGFLGAILGPIISVLSGLFSGTN